MLCCRRSACHCAMDTYRIGSHIQKIMTMSMELPIGSALHLSRDLELICLATRHSYLIYIQIYMCVYIYCPHHSDWPSGCQFTLCATFRGRHSQHAGFGDLLRHEPETRTATFIIMRRKVVVMTIYIIIIIILITIANILMYTYKMQMNTIPDVTYV